MRNKILILISIASLVLVLVGGCIPGITPTPEPEEPAPVMEAVALAELDEIEGEWTIIWSIVNVGDTFIREYTLIFKVDYPDVPRDYIVIEETGEYLEVGEMHSGETELLAYATPKSVSVRWELYE